MKNLLLKQNTSESSIENKFISNEVHKFCLKQKITLKGNAWLIFLNTFVIVKYILCSQIFTVEFVK